MKKHSAKSAKKTSTPESKLKAPSKTFSAPVIQVVRPGDISKTNPFTICIIANPALETPWNSGTFTQDPIMTDPNAFNACVRYIDDCLFGSLPNQRERFMVDLTISTKIRVVSVFAAGLPAEDQNSLVGQDINSDILVARRTAFNSFLSRFCLAADVAYAVSRSPSHTRASAWFTSDDDTRSGVDFILDGARFCHRFYNVIPGTVAIHSSETSLTALHEFGHALSSYTNGEIVDLYADSSPGLNCKHGRPIPPNFAVYNGTTFASDRTRDSMGYPDKWQSYHCELNSPTFPAVMDDYYESPDREPEHCEHDKITRQFLLDRLRAKTTR